MSRRREVRVIITGHHASCTPHYPEKPRGERPQHLTRVVLDDGGWVDVCADCGGTIVSGIDPSKGRIDR